MKTHKRDRTQRAWSKGYHAGLVGMSKEACPYAGSVNVRHNWMVGWRQAKENLSHGLE
ncbi:ribosome modulation factor [Pelagibaculum spongiae]|uniref:Ribosome modulation factor n=1 Tax=Pelagibaculum spongiae TaxID=2080658 RepID=A0A2V1GUP8_9GAMM|nr:ribosome modulation factor [Pelagibaculum spongiae]PVZ69796.1 ribosome modulation factor [Pelagibaculum spongiae]